MNKIVNKVISVGLCAAVIAGTAGAVYALNSDKNAKDTEVSQLEHLFLILLQENEQTEDYHFLLIFHSELKL